jgi:hypothetical protein
MYLKVLRPINDLKRALYIPWLSNLNNAFNSSEPIYHRQVLDRRSVYHL